VNQAILQGAQSPSWNPDSPEPLEGVCSARSVRREGQRGSSNNVVDDTALRRGIATPSRPMWQQSRTPSRSATCPVRAPSLGEALGYSIMRQGHESESQLAFRIRPFA
jgi:hypothetical protein